MGTLDELMAQLPGQVRGPNGEAMPQTIPDAPNVADMYRNSSSQSAPQPDAPPQAAPGGGGIRGFLSGALHNFLSGGDEAQLKRSQSANLASETAMRQKQMDQMGSMVTIMTPNGPMQVPFALAQKMAAPSVAGQYRVQGAQIGADSKETVADTAAQAKVDVAKISQGQQVPVDESVANLVGMPDLAGKSAGKATWSTINSALKARGYQYKDLGNDGLWLMDRGGNKIKRIADSPSLATAAARGESYARSRAQWSPFETVDDAGQPTTISTAQALSTGAPGISRTNLTQVKGKQALIEDIRGGVQQVRDTSSVLDRPGVKTRVAALLADPGITTSVFAQSPLAGTMQPDEQQYVINLLNLKENAMAMRSVLGAGQGSEDLRSAITKTIPNAMTPDSKYANAQLDTFLKTLDRLEKGIPQVRKPGSSIPPAARTRTDAAGVTLPDAVVSKLAEGHNTQFANGQVWTKKNGQPVRVK